MSATIGIMVNGFNNATVKYSSEHYEDELDGREKRSPFKAYFVPAAIEFLAYFAISFVALIPLVLISSVYLAMALCCLITLVLLFAAGYWRGYLMHMHPMRDGREMMLLGAPGPRAPSSTGSVRSSPSSCISA
jgi:VIT1/CCC1 family predicted Fe2+/Mn2+ transporter